ncbi:MULTISPECIES: alpha-hydroxy-acid oxidizing protein [Comamonas]|uniref:alpha-hydroxy-acid oxidizing protein n=1 Tax=Comamonas TaxID=283 RepID=UPI0012BFCA03|nr:MULTISPECIES: alpha-hydroxy-acid oxidizing protein [Comamonas]MEB5964140.1 alpha-hydroxy-acid oxidizing protein [Comamonas testosteroni]MPS95526.1 mandelate dehydrogenase [Comamonas sp.]
MTLEHCINIEDLRVAARRRLPRMVFDFVEGGAEDETGLARNRNTFDDWQFVPRRMVNVSHRDLRTGRDGTMRALPFGIGPTGLNGLLWPQGDLHLARAAQRKGIGFALSTAANLSIDELAQKVPGGDHWFQLYIVHRGLAGQLVQKALNAGYRTLVMTVDVPLNGKRERDVRSGFGLPFRYTPRVIQDIARHPRWAWSMLRHGAPRMANFAGLDAHNVELQAALLARQMDSSFDWPALQWIRDLWPHRLLVKGILHADDAAACARLGVDGLILSNHGGRQIDHSISALDALPHIRAALPALPVWVDGGVRRGSDVVKAMALGASGVLLARATLYGLACAGQAGAEQAIEILRGEIDNTLANLGCPSIDQLQPEHLHRSRAREF